MFYKRKRKVRDKHICICGLPRSGSSLLFNILANSFDSYSCSDFEESAKARIEEAGNWITKRPLDIFDIDEIRRLNREQKEILFILTIRDVREILVSIHPNVPFDYFIGHEGSYYVFGEHPNYEQVFQGPGIGKMFTEIEKVMTIPKAKLLLVRYEDLLGNLDGIQLKLESIGFRPEEKISSVAKKSLIKGMRYEGKHKALKADLVLCNQPPVIGKEAKWRKKRFRQRITSQFLRYPQLFDILEQYGYESNREWFKEFIENT